jgi:hypothetical protein
MKSANDAEGIRLSITEPRVLNRGAGTWLGAGGFWHWVLSDIEDGVSLRPSEVSVKTVWD